MQIPPSLWLRNLKPRDEGLAGGRAKTRKQIPCFLVYSSFPGCLEARAPYSPRPRRASGQQLSDPSSHGTDIPVVVGEPCHHSEALGAHYACSTGIRLPTFLTLTTSQVWSPVH